MRIKASLMGRFGGGLLAAIMAFGLLGCGGSDAPTVFHVSGSVNFDGKPVPGGRIRFVPDGSKQNSGPPGYAQIIDGKYDTSAEGGKGHVGGPMVVYIEGNDSSQSEANVDETDPNAPEPSVNILFPSYETSAELPKEDSTQDFEVPAEAGQVKSGGPA